VVHTQVTKSTTVISDINF